MSGDKAPAHASKAANMENNCQAILNMKNYIFIFCAKCFFRAVNWSKHEACKFELGLKNVFPTMQPREKKLEQNTKLFGKLEISKETFASEKNVGISRIKR